MATTASESYQPANKFSTEDYAVFVAMLSISAIIGLYYAAKSYFKKSASNTEEFLMGSRSMSVFPVSMSLLASFISAITLLGQPAEMYSFGTQFWMQVFVFPVIIFGTTYFFLPVFFNLKLTSSYEARDITKFNLLLEYFSFFFLLFSTWSEDFRGVSAFLVPLYSLFKW